jgi:tetratricopeptide (TPR) repeat protein
MTANNIDQKTFLNVRPELLIGLLLVTLTLAVYWQVRNHSFVNFDDGLYVTDNYHVRAGLSLESVKWALTETEAANWHPLTRLSHMLDVQLFGMNAGAHHMTSMFFHLANALLLFFVFKRMTGCLWQSGFVAALFILHPLHVESVAWVSERKDVLSTFFWLLTMGGYVLYVERPGKIKFLIPLLFFALGLMAKPMLVTLPFVLLLMDYWPLGRLGGEMMPFASTDVSNRSDNPNPASVIAQPVTGGQRALILGMVIEKVPFFALSAASCWMTIHAQQGKGAVGSLEKFPIVVRVANAVVSYVKYIAKTIWPENLAAYYPHPGIGSWWWVLAAGLLLVVISILAVRTIRQLPWFIVGWLWYLGTLVPVIGLLQVGAQAMADRYTYVPLIGLFIITAWGFPELIAGWRNQKKLLALAGAFLLITLMVSSWFQVRHWKNSMALYEHALHVTQNNYFAHDGMGLFLASRGKNDEAIDQYSEALRIRPDFAEAHNHLGNVLKIQGIPGEAIDHYKEALRIKPEYAEAYYNLGHILAGQGKIADAVKQYSAALKLRPEYPEVHYHLGSALMNQGKTDEAIAHFLKALNKRPTDAKIFNQLGYALVKKGKINEAGIQFSKAVQIEPHFAKAHYNLGHVLLNQGRLNRAVFHYSSVLQIEPENAGAHFALGSVYLRQGKLDEAIVHNREALRLRPGHARTHNNLGIAMIRKGMIEEATAHFEMARKIQPGHENAQKNLNQNLQAIGKQKEDIAQKKN